MALFFQGHKTLNNKIKITFLLPNLTTGGAQKVLTNVARFLNRDEFEVSLVSILKQRQKINLGEDIEYYNLNQNRVATSIFAIKKILLKINSDLVVSTLPQLNLYLSLLKFLLPRKLKVVIRESSLPSKRIVDMNPFVYNFAYNKRVGKLDKIICQSLDMVEDLKQNYNIAENKLIEINNPVNTRLIQKKSAELVSFEIKQLICVGRIHKAKGLDRIVDAMLYLDESIELTLVGDGPDKAILEKQIKENRLEKRVHLLGYQSNPYPYLAKSTLVILPSRYEGFPNVLIEAGSLGIPFVSFPIKGGINQILEEGINGFKSKEETPESLANAINKALKHSFDSEQIIALTERKFGLEIIVEKYANVFKQLFNIEN